MAEAMLLPQTVQSEPELDAARPARLVGAPSPVHEDLARYPIQLNERFQVTADGIQWIVQRRIEDTGRGVWKSVIWCQTKDGLIANIGYEVFGVGEVDRPTLQRLKSLPAHRRLAPGWEGRQEMCA